MSKITLCLLTLNVILVCIFSCLNKSAPLSEKPSNTETQQHDRHTDTKRSRPITETNLSSFFDQKEIFDFTINELTLLLETQESELLRDLAKKFDKQYKLHPSKTVALLNELAEESIDQGLYSAYLQFSAQAKSPKELNKIEFNVIEAWLKTDTQACLNDCENCKEELTFSHRLSLLSSVYMENTSLNQEAFLKWGDALGEDRGILAHKLTVHFTEQCRDSVHGYFKRNMDNTQVQACLIPFLLNTPKHMAENQMKWLTTLNLSQSDLAPQIVGSLFASTAKTNPELVVNTLNDTDYLDSFLTTEQKNSSLADFHQQEFYDHVLVNYIQSIAKVEFENANLALDNIVNPHLKKAATRHLDKLRPAFETNKRLSQHIKSLQK